MSFAQNVVSNEGAWCWFADPRAIHYANDTKTIDITLLGYIDIRGSIKATQIDWLTGTRTEVLIRAAHESDDHDNPTFLVLPDENDDVKIIYGPKQMVQSTGARPYAKYQSNGKDKLYVTYTTGHPDNEMPNWVYFNVIGINGGDPVLMSFTRLDDARTTHNFYYTRWTGSEWRETEIGYAGHAFHKNWSSRERCRHGTKCRPAAEGHHDPDLRRTAAHALPQ